MELAAAAAVQVVGSVNIVGTRFQDSLDGIIKSEAIL